MSYTHLELLQLSTCSLLEAVEQFAQNTRLQISTLLGVISKTYFVGISYRVAALNKAILYHRKEQKQTNP